MTSKPITHNEAPPNYDSVMEESRHPGHVTNPQQVDPAQVIVTHPVPGGVNPYIDGARVRYPRTSIPITCQFCHSQVTTEVEDKCAWGSVCLLILLFIICLPIGFCLFFRGNSIRNIRHICPNCNRHVGSA